MKKISEHIRKWGWLCLLLLAAGCEREEVGMGTEAAEETFSLRCVAEAMGGVRTRAEGEQPAVIKEYTVMIYRKTGTGTPEDNVLVRKEEVAGDGPLTFTAQQDTSEHYMYVLANAKGKLPDLGSKEQQLLDTKDVELLPTEAVELTESPVMCSSKITLRHFDLVTFYKVISGGIVPLKRNLARLIIRFSVSSAVFEPQEVTYVSMTGTSYLVERKNVNTKDYLEPMTRTGGDWEKPMYLFEQATVRNQNDGDWKEPGFFLILGGNYKGETNFYKFGLPAIDGTFVDIERNMSYVLNITDIKNNGYSDKNEAMKHTTLFSNVVVMIKPNIEGMEDLNEIYTNGYYEMGLNSSEYHFYQAAFHDTLTKVVTKALDASVSDERLSLTGDPGFYKEDINGQTFLSFNSQNARLPDSDGFYSTTLVYGTLRKTVKVKMGNPISWAQDTVLKFQASNGEVGGPPNNPGWMWYSGDWCGLGPNSRFNATDYFGKIKNSLNENIFVHIRKVVDTPPEGDDVRRAILVASDHVIEVTIQRQ